jgi:hypothetical protein
MPGQTESEMTRRMCRDLHRLGCLVLDVVGHEMQEPGWPDRYVVLPSALGPPVWLEFKNLHGRLTTKQEMILRRLRAMRVPAYVVRLKTNRLEDEKGTVLGSFDGTAEGLIACLREMHSGRT